MTAWMTDKGVTSETDTYYTTLLDSLNGTSGVVTTGMATLTTDTTTKNNDMKTAAETYGNTRFAIFFSIASVKNKIVKNVRFILHPMVRVFQKFRQVPVDRYLV